VRPGQGKSDLKLVQPNEVKGVEDEGENEEERDHRLSPALRK